MPCKTEKAYSTKKRWEESIFLKKLGRKLATTPILHSFLPPTVPLSFTHFCSHWDTTRTRKQELEGHSVQWSHKEKHGPSLRMWRIKWGNWKNATLTMKTACKMSVLHLCPSELLEPYFSCYKNAWTHFNRERTYKPQYQVTFCSDISNTQARRRAWIPFAYNKAKHNLLSLWDMATPFSAVSLTLNGKCKTIKLIDKT